MSIEATLQLAFARHLRLVAEALHDLEWVLSFDKSPGDEKEAIRKVVTPQDELKSSTEDAKLALSNLNVAIKKLEK